tara:strand:- start:8794 stop:9054 length:261 start_codon:yes stop_codon:yes gene_type:complete
MITQDEWSWFIPKSLNDENRNTYTKKASAKEFREKNTLRHCLKCHKVWEPKTSAHRSIIGPIIFYIDFPKYGIKKKKCYYCHKEEE